MLRPASLNSTLSALACAALSAAFAGCSGTGTSALPHASVNPAQAAQTTAAQAAAASDVPAGAPVAAARLQQITHDLQAAHGARSASALRAAATGGPTQIPNPDGLAASPSSLSFPATGTGSATRITISSKKFGIIVPLVQSNAPCVQISPLGALGERRRGATSDVNYYATFSILPIRNGACTIDVYEVDFQSLATQVLSRIEVPAAVGVQPSPSPSPRPQSATVYALSSASTVDVYDGASSGTATPKATWNITPLSYGDTGAPSIATDPSSGNVFVSNGFNLYGYSAGSTSGNVIPTANLALSGSVAATGAGAVHDFSIDPAGNLYTTETSTAGDVFAFVMNGASSGALAPTVAFRQSSTDASAGIASNGNTVAVDSTDCTDMTCATTFTSLRLYHTPLAANTKPFASFNLGGYGPYYNYGVAMDNAGDVFVVDENLNRVDMFAPGDGTYGQGMTASVAPNAGTIEAIAVDHAGNLYVMSDPNPQFGQGIPVPTVTIAKYGPKMGAQLATFGPLKAQTIAAY